MNPLPRDPYAFQARVMEALIGDIAERDAKGFDRLNALRAVTKGRFLEEESGQDNDNG